MNNKTKPIIAKITIDKLQYKYKVSQSNEEIICFINQNLKTLQYQNFQIVISNQYEQESANILQNQIIDPYGYDIELMKEQILLFDRESEMINYIQTQKILAFDPIKQLTSLSCCLLKLSKSLLSQKKPILGINTKQRNYSKQQLDKIESECINTLIRIKQQKKRIQNCCICLNSKSNMIIIPCMHYVLCQKCINPLLMKCPICKQPIIDIKEVYQ